MSLFSQYVCDLLFKWNRTSSISVIWSGKNIWKVQSPTKKTILFFLVVVTTTAPQNHLHICEIREKKWWNHPISLKPPQKPAKTSSGAVPEPQSHLVTERIVKSNCIDHIPGRVQQQRMAIRGGGCLRSWFFVGSEVGKMAPRTLRDYPVVTPHITTWNIPMLWMRKSTNCSCSIAMLVYQKVYGGFLK